MSDKKNTCKEFRRFFKKIASYIKPNEDSYEKDICLRFFGLILGFDLNKKQDCNNPAYEFVQSTFAGQANDEKLRKITYGTGEIPQSNCKYFLSNMDINKFKLVFDELPSSAQQGLTSAMRYYYGDVCLENCHEKIMQVFTIILKKFTFKSSLAIPVFDPYPDLVDSDFVEVIERLSTALSGNDETELLYNPKNIKEKISDSLLCNKVKGNLVYNFCKLDEIISNIDTNARINKMIRFAWLEEQKNNNDISTSFENIVNAIMGKGKCSREKSETIVSYFIQKCEVF